MKVKMRVFILLIALLSQCFVQGHYQEMQASKETQGEYQSILMKSGNLREEQSAFVNQSEIINTLVFKFKAESEYQADVQFTDGTPGNNRFSMPNIEPFDTLYKDSKPSEQASTSSVFKFVRDVSSSSFNFKIVRISTEEVVFSEDISMVFSENYLKYTTVIPSNDIFGIGERNILDFRLKKGLYTLNGVDQLYRIDDGKTGGNGVYGSHPVYLVREQSGNYNIVFYKNPTPSDCIIEEKKITFKSVGGIIHFKIFFGDKNPETVIRRFHSYLGGGHALPPFWAFGFHQSRWGYSHEDVVLRVIENHEKKGIPLDTIWSDIDFMFEKQTFTVDNTRFSDSFYKKLYQDIQINYVPIVDCGVGAKDFQGKNLALKKGIEMDIFLRSPHTGKRFKGRVWPGESYFPDFLHPKSKEYWSFMMHDLYKKVNFTGIWLDMNEPSNFCVGECTDWVDQSENNEPNKDFISKPINLPYVPGKQNLEIQTLPLNLIHYGNYTHKDVHNLYGFMDAYITHYALKEKLNKTYPFILTRSSFTGSGRFTFKWGGDNESLYPYMQISLVSLLNFNIFGIPFMGADICGFLKNTNPELCQRWIQLGSLYPFARNHNNDQAKSQEFYALGEDVMKTSIKNLKLRYSILKHYYMLFVRTNHQGTVFRPLFFEFPSEKECLEDSVLNTQFMLGKELMSSPIMTEKQNTANVYFPSGDWFDLLSGYKIKEGEKGQFKQVYCPLIDTVPLFLRSGSLIGFQDTKNVLKTQDLNNEFKLICGLQQVNSTIYSCQGNILNLNNYLDEDEVQQSCDQEFNSNLNCLLSITISVNTDTRKIRVEVTSQDDDVWKSVQNLTLKNIAIDSLLLYNFPIVTSSKLATSQPKLQKLDGSDLSIGVLIKKYNYIYNRYVGFEKKKLNLSQNSSFVIVL